MDVVQSNTLSPTDGAPMVGDIVTDGIPCVDPRNLGNQTHPHFERFSAHIRHTFALPYVLLLIIVH